MTSLRALLLLSALAACSCATTATGDPGGGGGEGGGGFPDSGLGGDPADAGQSGAPDAAAALVGDSCAGPEMIVLDVDSATVTGTTAGYSRGHLAPPACNVSDAHVDHVYQIEVPEKQTLTVRLEGSDPSVATVSIQRACPDTSLVGGCTVGTPANGFEAHRDYQEAGAAYVFVWAEEDLDYTLDIRMDPI